MEGEAIWAHRRAAGRVDQAIEQVVCGTVRVAEAAEATLAGARVGRGYLGAERGAGQHAIYLALVAVVVAAGASGRFARAGLGWALLRDALGAALGGAGDWRARAAASAAALPAAFAAAGWLFTRGAAARIYLDGLGGTGAHDRKPGQQDVRTTHAYPK